MTAGDLLVASDQRDEIEWDGILVRTSPVGSGSVWLSGDSEVTGLGLAERAATVLARSTGGAPGAVRVLPGEVTATSVMVEGKVALAALRTAMRPTWVPQPLCWDGHGHDGRRFLWAVPQRMSAPSRVLGGVSGLYRVDLQWRADDPRTYDLVERTYDPLTYADPLEAENDGDAEAPFVAVIPGPVTDPRIRRGVTDEESERFMLRWVGFTVPSGQTFTIDTRARSAVLSGSPTVNRWAQATLDDGVTLPEEWGIVPGGSTLRFGPSGATEVEVTSRDTWL